jgi:hypothetical protein
MAETEGPQMMSQHGAYALRAGLLARLHPRMHMHTPTRLGSHMHARIRTHRQISNTFCFPRQQ